MTVDSIIKSEINQVFQTLEPKIIDSIVKKLEKVIEQTVKRALKFQTNAIVKGQLSDIVLLYCNNHAINASVLIDKGRTQSVVDHRHILCFILHEHYSFSYHEIGFFFQRDHTTILNSVVKCESLMLTESSWNKRVKRALNLLTSVI